ncbi:MULTISPECIES: hypothetical protein [unclassified Streptomyces]|nr:MULTISPECIES: hypothetical protein [unclassified Streptomyces]
MSTGAAQPPGTGGNPYQQPGYHAPNPYQDATVGPIDSITNSLRLHEQD